ncbi:conserved protein of unknown function [Methanocaldococcus lauensis]|uniref:Uncharacterized protein n=1 Tax=Methanocaldococcus lauensis TaxID=2546128 RepID=A0A8D6PXA9_9EURY|nr:hypothetical protein [Methanocaldococcus lauensis]CAB3289145.1 conserved protein of unknown function [Methanocaldococcus lauensis]
MRFKFIVLLMFIGLVVFTVNGLEIKDVEYYDNSQYLIITINNPNNNINANISIVGYINNKIDTKVEMYNYTIPKNSLLFIRKKLVFKEKGEHNISIIIKSNNTIYTFLKKINITYAYDSRVPIYKEMITKNIEIEGLYFEKDPAYPWPFYDFIYVIVKNNDIIPHYVNISLTSSLNGNYYTVDNDKIIKSNPPNSLVIKSWTPSVYIPPKSQKIIPIKVNFYYAGDYKISINVIDDEGHSDKEVYNKISIECPLYIYNVTCEEEYNNFAYSNWFDIEVNNTADYDIYGTLYVFLCKKEGNNYIIIDNKTINSYFLAKGFCEGYSIPIKLNTSVLNPYDKDFVIFVIYKTGTICNSYQKTFKKPITINNLEVKNYPKNYYFVDENIFYDVYINITNNLNKYINANISITDIYNRTYSKEVKLTPKKYKNYNIIKFDGLKINAKDLSHDGKIKLKFTITAITPPYEKYYIIKRNETTELSLIPTPPVYIQDSLNDEIFVGYYQNLSFILKKVVGKTVYARLYITVPDEINNSAFFEEKYLKIRTMEEIPVNIKAMFLKEYNGPIYIHVDTNMGVRECVVTRIIEAKPIISCEDVYFNNYTVFIKIRNRTQGFVMNQPIVGYPTNVTISLESYVPNLKDIEIWASAMDENGRLINCSKKKKINIYGNHKKINLEILFNDSLEGYLIIYAKTGKATIPIYYKPIMVTYPIKFELKYNSSNSWADLILSHNYQVPLKVVATVNRYSKEITIYPYKETIVPFYVGENRSNISVTIELLDNISSIKKFKKTFYFNKLKMNRYNNISNSLINTTINTKYNENTTNNSLINITKSTRKTSNSTLPPNIELNSNNTTKIHNISKEKLELFYNLTGLNTLKKSLFTLKGLLYLVVIGIVILLIVLLMNKHLEISSIILYVLYKIRFTHKKSKKEICEELLNPPKVYMSNIVYSLGDTARMEILSEVDVSNRLYVLSPTNKKYKIELIKVERNKYVGLFKIPEDEIPGQYFIIYDPKNLSIAGFLVIDIKK